MYTPAPVVYTPAPITYNTPQKLKPFTNFVNLTPYKPSTEEEPEEEPEEEREGKLVVVEEEDRSVEDTAEQEVAFEEESMIENPSREAIPVEFSSNNVAEEVETRDPLGPPEKGRTGPGIMHPFVDLGGEVEVVAEEGGLVESEKLVLEPILIISSEAPQSGSSTTTPPTSTTSTTTIRPISEARSSPPKREKTTSVHPLPFPFQTTSENLTTETPTTTTMTSSERMEKLLEMAMERLKEMEEIPESSSDS